MEFVNPLDLRHVLLCELLRSRIAGNKAVVSFDAFPNPKLANVILKDAGAEIDVVLYFKKLDALAIRGMPPSWLCGPNVDTDRTYSKFTTRKNRN